MASTTVVSSSGIDAKVGNLDGERLHEMAASSFPMGRAASKIKNHDVSTSTRELMTFMAKRVRQGMVALVRKVHLRCG